MLVSNLDDACSLNNISLEIYKGQHIGITGRTGSGKSTFLDILMGLLSPSKGYLKIDNITIKDSYSLNEWQENITHVPQFIYLSDATIAENIALGIDPNFIDYEKIRYCVDMAELSVFVNTIKGGIMANVGERGIKLSGGERQRIGIARAIYKMKSLLILDEATSALDDETQNKIMNNLRSLRPEITILMVAHRLSSIENCDRVIKIDDGSIKLD